MNQVTNMKNFGFMVAHGYEIWAGYLSAKTKSEAEELIKNEEWYDIIDEYDTDDFTEGFEVIEIWEI